MPTPHRKWLTAKQNENKERIENCAIWALYIWQYRIGKSNLRYNEVASHKRLQLI